MKQLILILLSAILLSCSTNTDDSINYHFEYVPVISVEAPTEFVFGEVHQIKVKYTLPNSCFRYYSYNYVYQGDSREVTTFAIVNDEAACTQAIIEGEYTINVEALQQEAYTFKFWQGEGDYLTVIIPVI